MLRTFLTLAILAASVQAADPPKDRDGDPLPDGVVARLGTTRMRLGSGDIAIGSLSVSRDGKRVACLELGHIHVFEVDSGKTLRRFDYPILPARCEALTISSDGKFLLAASNGGNILCWNIDSGEIVSDTALRGDSFRWFGLGFRPNGDPIYTRSLDDGEGKFALLVEAKTGRTLHTFREEDWSPTSVDIQPDGETFMGGQYLTEEGKVTVRVFGKDFKRKSACVIDLKEVPRNVGLSGDGSTIIVVHGLGKVSLWNPSDGSLRSETDELPKDAKHEVPACVSWDGKTAAVSGFGDGTVRLFDTATGKRLKTFSGAGAGGHVAMSRDGKRLFHRGKHRLQVWDIDTGTEKHLNFEAHREPVEAIAFSPDNKEVATMTLGEIRFWDARTGAFREKWKLPDQNDPKRLRFSFSLAYSPNGKSVLWLDPSSLMLRDRATGKKLHEWDGVMPLAAFFADGKRMLFLPKRDERLEIRDLESGEKRSELDGKGSVWSLDVSPKGDRVAIFEAQGLTIRDLDKGNEIANFPKEETEHHFKPIFDSTGHTLRALRFEGRCLTVFDPAARKSKTGPSNTEGYPDFHSMAYSERLLACVDGFLVDRFINAEHGRFTDLKLIDTATGRVRFRQKLLQCQIPSMAFSADGRYLATALGDTSVLIWDTWNLPCDPFVPPQPTEEMVREQWERLTDDTSESTEWSLQVMCKRPEVTVPLLTKKLQPAEKVDAERLRKLVADLGSDRFAVRQRASVELTKLGESAVDELRKCRETTESEEVRRRIDTILGEVDQLFLSGERLRTRRALEILERISTPEAKELLRSLAKGNPTAEQTREAKAILKE